MPSALDNNTESTIRGGHEQARPTITKPLTYSGSLDSYAHKDLTPVIGREYTGLQVAQVLESEDRERLITDIAVTGMCSIPCEGT
jgi:hypothetical protein